MPPHARPRNPAERTRHTRLYPTPDQPPPPPTNPAPDPPHRPHQPRDQALAAGLAITLSIAWILILIALLATHP